MYHPRGQAPQSHPYYRLFYLLLPELKEELKNWSRQDVISWLKWNDPNGIYADKESKEEIGKILGYRLGCSLIIKHVKGAGLNVKTHSKEVAGSMQIVWRLDVSLPYHLRS